MRWSTSGGRSSDWMSNTGTRQLWKLPLLSQFQSEVYGEKEHTRSLRPLVKFARAFELSPGNITFYQQTALRGSDTPPPSTHGLSALLLRFLSSADRSFVLTVFAGLFHLRLQKTPPAPFDLDLKLHSLQSLRDHLSSTASGPWLSTCLRNPCHPIAERAPRTRSQRNSGKVPVPCRERLYGAVQASRLQTLQLHPHS